MNQNDPYKNEREFCVAVVRLAQQHRLPFERAVELFGRLANTMVVHADPQQAASKYLHAFLAGMGATDQVAVEAHLSPPPKEQH